MSRVASLRPKHPAGDSFTNHRSKSVKCGTGEINFHDQNVTSSKGEALGEQFFFPCGIHLYILDFYPERSQSVYCSNMHASVGIGFCVSGHLNEQWHKSREHDIAPGQYAIYAHPDMEAHSRLVPGEHFRRVTIGAFTSDLPALEDAYPELFRLSLFKPQNDSAFNVRSICTRYHIALMQMLHCPFSDTARRIFLEGKVMEILSYAIEEEQRHSKGWRGINNSTVETVDKAHHIAYLITCDLSNPPDLHSVAQKAGVCKSKLHKIFRQVYDVTPFEYLRLHRMEKAREMLLEGRVNVAEAATAVGYSSTSHFSKAYASHFNLLPSETKETALP